MTRMEGSEGSRRVPGVGAIVVPVDAEIEDLVPAFLANRRQDVTALQTAVADGDADTVRAVGHRLKGMGGGYGFDYITMVGAALERAALDGRLDEAPPWIDGLRDFLARVEAVPDEG